VYHKKKPDGVRNLYEPIETSASLLRGNTTIGKLRSVRVEKIMDDLKPIKITLSFSKTESHPTAETAVTIHQFSLV